MKKTILSSIPLFLKNPARDAYRKITGKSDETTDTYRRILFDELIKTSLINYSGKRILEIGPKDGLDSIRLSGLLPSELIMIDLPEKNRNTQTYI